MIHYKQEETKEEEYQSSIEVGVEQMDTCLADQRRG